MKLNMENIMENEIPDAPETPSRWQRLIPMVILLVCLSLAESIYYVLALVQFIWAMIEGKPNARLASFGASLAEWVRVDGRYLSYASEEKPFPWAAWPKA